MRAMNGSGGNLGAYAKTFAEDSDTPWNGLVFSYSDPAVNLPRFFSIPAVLFVFGPPAALRRKTTNKTLVNPKAGAGKRSARNLHPRRSEPAPGALRRQLRPNLRLKPRTGSGRSETHVYPQCLTTDRPLD
jgi:hypothetical protein